MACLSLSPRFLSSRISSSSSSCSGRPPRAGARARRRRVHQSSVDAESPPVGAELRTPPCGVDDSRCWHEVDDAAGSCRCDRCWIGPDGPRDGDQLWTPCWESAPTRSILVDVATRGTGPGTCRPDATRDRLQGGGRARHRKVRDRHPRGHGRRGRPPRASTCSRSRPLRRRAARH